MVKIKVVTKTTYFVDMPIESFDDISEPKMTIEESDEFIKKFLRNGFKSKYDEIICVDTAN